jgi:hypothetical protein
MNLTSDNATISSDGLKLICPSDGRPKRTKKREFSQCFAAAAGSEGA